MLVSDTVHLDYGICLSGREAKQEELIAWQLVRAHAALSRRDIIAHGRIFWCHTA